MNKSKAFTLIEMLVAVTVFTLVIGSTTGLFISAIRSQAKALAAQKLLDETSFVMEYTSRFLRMARKELAAPTACLSSSGLNYETNLAGDRIIFINSQDVCQEFYLDAGRLKEDRNGVFFGELTSNKLEITSLQFNLSGATQPPTEYLQPRVTISMTIRKAGATKPEIKIQTTISQRNLDVQQ